MCKELDIPPDLVYYFGLFLIERRQHSGELVVLRKLQDFESPYISQRSSTRKLVIRKA